MADMTEFLKLGAAGIEDHARIYVETDGGDEAHYRDMSPMGGRADTKTLLLKTIGRKSGAALLAPLIYKDRGDDFIIVASKAGSDHNPAWFHNITAAEEVAAQVGPKRHRCKWRIAKGAEREAIWAEMADYYPPYLEYQARTEREIPVVVLTPVGEIAEKFSWRPGDGVDRKTSTVAR
jgi:deazaflavin-dependent oxidoreductase (nitroreductase family)